MTGRQGEGYKTKKALERASCVGEGGLEPPNGFPDRFTVCCNCHYATPPAIKRTLSLFDAAKIHLFSKSHAGYGGFFASLHQ